MSRDGNVGVICRRPHEAFLTVQSTQPLRDFGVRLFTFFPSLFLPMLAPT